MINVPIKIVTIFAVILISSCAGTKNIDFESAYKFSQYTYKKGSSDSIVVPYPGVAEEHLQASLNQKESEIIKDHLVDIEEKIYSKVKLTREERQPMEVNALVTEFQKLSRKEKRELRRDIKVELKKFKNYDAINSLEPADIHKLNASTDYTRLVILIGGAGLLLLILGAIFSGFLIFVGALAVVAAAVLFIIDQA